MFAAGLIVAACANQTKLRQAELDEAATWLPGIYDNREQVDAERAAGRIVHEAITLSIVPIYAPMLSETVFYMQETASDDPRRVLTQRISSFVASQDGRIIETIWTFVDPTRWREGLRSPELFKSLLAQDLTQAHGCERVWRQAGARFRGTNDPQKCRAVSATGALVPIATTTDLGRRDLLLERHVSGQGGVQGVAAPPGEFHFVKRAETAGWGL
jgi:hypothetical protein